MQVHHEAREHRPSVSVATTTGSPEPLGRGVRREARNAEATAGPANEEMTAPPTAMATSGPEESKPETPPTTAGVAMLTANEGTTGTEVRDLVSTCSLMGLLEKKFM